MTILPKQTSDRGTLKPKDPDIRECEDCGHMHSASISCVRAFDIRCRAYEVWIRSPVKH